jgi:hypothetical protein
MKILTGENYRRKLEHLSENQLSELKERVGREYEFNYRRLARVGENHKVHVEREKKLERVSQDIVREERKRRDKRNREKGMAS